MTRPAIPPWIRSFPRLNRLFEPILPAARMVGCDSPTWPPVAAWQRALAHTRTASDRPLRVVDADRLERLSARDYEQSVETRGELPVRADTWHDLFNVLVWSTYPAIKGAINRLHVEHILDGTGSSRGSLRDTLTLLDENGVVVACTDPELAVLLRDMRWEELFVTCRARVVAGMRPFVVGHGLLEKLLEPYVGLTAHALIVPVERSFVEHPPEAQLAWIDTLGAALVAEVARTQGTAGLCPLPLLGWPGVFGANEDPSFYRDRTYFRPARTGRARHT